MAYTIQIWLNALTKPANKTYEEIYESEQASMGRALIWIICATLISIVLNKLGMALLPYHPLNQLSTPRATPNLSAEQVRQITESMRWLTNSWFLLFGGPIIFLF